MMSLLVFVVSLPSSLLRSLLDSFLASLHFHRGGDSNRSNHGFLDDMQIRRRGNNLVRREGIELRRAMFNLETGWIAPSTLRQPRQPRPRRSCDLAVLAIAVFVVMVAVDTAMVTG